MVEESKSARNSSFKNHWPAWIVVRHFLSSLLLRELLEATVAEVTGGRLSLHDLIEETQSGGEPALSTWALRLKPTDDQLGRYLQEYVRAIVWQGDSRYPADREWSDHERDAVEALKGADSLSTTDLPTSTMAMELANPSLLALQACLESARDVAAGSPPDATLALVQDHFGDVALRSLVLKHLGDLLVDVEAWDGARALYEAAAASTADIPAQIWSGLRDTLPATISMSLVGVQRAISDAAEVLGRLQEIEADARHSNNWVALANVADDLFDASFSAGAYAGLRDLRVAVLSMPTLLPMRHLSHALESWLERRYDDAYRWFWSVLRRQTALGSARNGRFTKSLYARCIIEGVHARFDSERPIEWLRTGIRLLIESGTPKAAEHSEWSEVVVATGIDRTSLEFAVKIAKAAPGFEAQRISVLLTLLPKWASKLPPDRKVVANEIIEIISEFAGGSQSSHLSDHNVRGSALKALLAIARSKPEFRKVAGSAVLAATTKCVVDRSPIIRGDALKVALEYSGALETGGLIAFTEVALRMLDEMSDHSSSTIVVGPALNFLHALYVRDDASLLGDLRGQIANTLMQLAANGSSQAAYIALLQDLAPQDAMRLTDTDRLGSIVSILSENALATNRSDASSSMVALLDAPKLVGRDAVQAAMKGLVRSVSSATEGRPDAAFSDAYRPLMSLSRNFREIAALFEGSHLDLQDQCNNLFEQLSAVWRRAQAEPLIFTTFAIPIPTTPNLVLVHNWAFGSMFFARVLEREDDMRVALDLASSKPELKNTIAVASAIEAPIDALDFGSASDVTADNADAFYASFGRRLVAITALPSEERLEPLRAMLTRCLSLGPRGEDAAVLSMAIGAGLRCEWESAARDYRRRLENDRNLRLSVGPLLSSLHSSRK